MSDVPVRAAIGLGSNMGDRRRHLDEATTALSDLGEIIAVSSYYETAPIGGPEQGEYLNAVVVIRTDVDPTGVLRLLLDIERRHDRQRSEKDGPRTLDLDLLLYGNRVIDEPGLSVPHPRMTERRFVLEPLVEAWPGARLPEGTEVAALLPAVADQSVDRVSP